MDEAKISMEVKNGSGNTEAFADDTNVTCKQKFSVLSAIKTILVDFSVISGLKCNLEKTCIMLIGPWDPVEAPLIEELGFSIVDKMKILGFTVSPEGLMEDDILHVAHSNIKNDAYFSGNILRTTSVP